MGESGIGTRHNLEPGLKLDGRYELLCILAQGGMANVWLARFTGKHGFAKLVAVKTILPNIAEDEQFKQMFLDEARVAAHIEHPNVVQINDVGDHAGVSYLVMDLIEGESLQGILRACDKQRKSLPLGVALRILADACFGLEAAHELRDPAGHSLNVVHRDVSPQNILVTVAGTAKVIDFGIAKARDRASTSTSAGTLKGKISFMPHEQALGRDVDRRTDTWALGAVLYLLLAGRPPYKGENQLATLQLAMTCAEIPPLPPGIPTVIRSIVGQALQHDPAQRFQSARALGIALEDAMMRLGLATTQLQVAQLLHERIGDLIHERRQFVSSALVEATNRERARAMLLSAPTIDADASGSLRPMQPVAIPPDLASSPPMAPTGTGSTAPLPYGTLAATTVEPVSRTRASAQTTLAIVVALLVALGASGLGLFVVLRPRRAWVPTAAASTAGVSATSMASSADPPPSASVPDVEASTTVTATQQPTALASAVSSARPSGKSTSPAFVKPPKVVVPAPTKAHDDEPGF